MIRPLVIISLFFLSINLNAQQNLRVIKNAITASIDDRDGYYRKLAKHFNITWEDHLGIMIVTPSIFDDSIFEYALVLRTRKQFDSLIYYIDFSYATSSIMQTMWINDSISRVSWFDNLSTISVNVNNISIEIPEELAVKINKILVMLLEKAVNYDPTNGLHCDGRYYYFLAMNSDSFSHDILGGTVRCPKSGTRMAELADLTENLRKLFESKDKIGQLKKVNKQCSKFLRKI
jgi:hypothetical protein